MHVWAIYLLKYHWSLCKFHCEFKWLKLPNLMVVMSLSRSVRACLLWRYFHDRAEIQTGNIFTWTSTFISWFSWRVVASERMFTDDYDSTYENVIKIRVNVYHLGKWLHSLLQNAMMDVTYTLNWSEFNKSFFSANFGKIRFVLSTRNFLQNDLSQLDSNSTTTFAYCFYDVNIEVSTRPSYQIFLLVFWIEDTMWHTTLSGLSSALAIHAFRSLFLSITIFKLWTS